jgi:CheY-like chemotaxis protein
MNQDEPVRLLLAEDQVMIREALAALLSFEGDIEVVAQVGRGDEVLKAAEATKPDVAVLDIEMPGMDGLTAAAELKKRSPDTKIVILTTFGRPASSAARWSPGYPRSWSRTLRRTNSPRPSAGCWRASASSTRTWPPPPSPTGSTR